MSETVITNIRVLSPSRRRLQPGDIFAIGLPDMTYLFGRVILIDLPRGQAPMPNSNLIYVYRYRASEPVPDVINLTPDNLLLAPTYINRLPWSRGYFQTVDAHPLRADDLLPQHCFRRFGGTYCDERGQPLPGAAEPCGVWGLASFRVVDDHISDALGLPRASE